MTQPVIAVTDGHRRLIVGSVMLATTIQALDSTIANVALPQMQAAFAATPDQVSWILTSYIISSAIMTAPAGYLSLRYGRKRVFDVAIIGFTVSSALCGLAETLPQMVLFRTLQGAFGAALIPISQAVILDIYPQERHGSAMALWGTGIMIGPILGPTLGGYLTDLYSWRWVFFINVPIGILALAGVLSTVPESEKDPKRPFDIFGFALLSLTVGAFQLMLDRGQTLDWFSSPEIIGEAVIAGLALYLFIVHMATAERPFLEPGLFRDRSFVGGCTLMFSVGLTMLATMAILPPFLQTLMGFPALMTGVVLAPRGVGMAIGMSVVGRLVNRVDPRLLIVFGLSVTALSIWQMSLFTTDVSVATIVWTGLLQGIGLGFIFTPSSVATFSSLPAQYRTEGAAIYNLLRNLGSGIGVSAAFTLVARNIQTNHALLAENVSPLNPILRGPDYAPLWALGERAGLAALDAEITRQAAAIAYLDDFRLMVFVTLLCAPLVLLLRRPQSAMAEGSAGG